MTRGQTQKGRERAEARKERRTPSRPLFVGHDHSDPVALRAKKLGFEGNGWIEPFLDANPRAWERLQLAVHVRSDRDTFVELVPGARVGAVPIVSPATRRVVGGVLIRPRFEWPRLGAVYQRIGFSVAPSVGGGLLVPGSARHVPAWLLAAPVLARIEALLAHARRGFAERSADRESPRGRIDWREWATRRAPIGQWTRFPCHYPEPELDPELAANLRWTFARLRTELERPSDDGAARVLIERIEAAERIVGAGAERRPRAENRAVETAFLADAVEAMTWVAEERGLGGARVLDGLAWDVSVEQVWEEWVRRFAEDLAPQLGLRAGSTAHRRVHLDWRGVRSMTRVEPDASMHGPAHPVWLDAKYKPHFAQLLARGWFGAGTATRDAHRADLHQALAYAACASTPKVDTALVYPATSAESREVPVSVAHLPAGARTVRVFLGALPFGFESPTDRDATLARWRAALAA